MPLITLAQAKEMMQIKNDTSKDGLINSLLKPIETLVISYTKNDFTDPTTGIQTFPEDLQLVAIQVIGRFINKKNWQGISSEHVDVNSVSIMNDLPAWCLTILKSYRRVKFIRPNYPTDDTVTW